MPQPPGPGMGFYGPSRASFGSRLVGFFIDGIIVSSIIMVVGIVLFVIAIPLSDVETNCTVPGQPPSQPNCFEPESSTLLLWLILSLIFLLIYFVVVFLIHIQPLYKTGQTIGRRVMNIKVVQKADGSLLSPGQAFGRYLFAILVSGQFFNLGYLWMLWDDQDETWHDKVVKSTVINV